LIGFVFESGKSIAESLLAVAVAAALPVVAQAQVTLYGRLDMGVGQIDRGNTSKSMIVTDHSLNSTSRLGFRGTEKLTGGLDAIFQIEGGVTTDTGAAITFNRESWVGLSGGFGQIRLGRTLTPSFHSDAVGDIMGYSYFGGQGNWSGGGGGECVAGAAAAGVACPTATQTAGRGGYSTRVNGIHFTSPSMSGLVVRAAYAPSERDGTTQTTAATPANVPNSVGNAFDIGAVYSAGPLGVAVAYQDEKMNPANTISTSRTVTTLAGSYTIGTITLKGGYATSELGTGATLLDLTKTNLGLSAKVGVGTISVAYTMLEGEAGVAKTKREANVFGLAYNHPLSKNTSVYATYGRTDNKTASSTYGLYAGSPSYSPSAAGADVSGMGFGILHLF
jgi:predicted porin